ncbi:MAG: glycosyltransferase [Planctomycetota bacterium]|nr:glycosyltransferase [Planctomycetota bacterium]
MKIRIITPVEKNSNRGNEITALRWEGILRTLGHQVGVSHGRTCSDRLDLLIAIHATRCHPFLRGYRDLFPQAPVVVCLSGTDLHGALERPGDSCGMDSDDNGRRRERTLESLAIADRIVLLEPEGQKKVPDEFQSKCRVVFQSAAEVENRQTPPSDRFQVSVIGHLREVKDPFRTAMAARQLPSHSRVSILHVGAALNAEMKEAAMRESVSNRFYTWLGKKSHRETMEILTSSHLTVLSSFHEGAPSVISEAVMNRVPLLSSRMDASIGLLGSDYPGLFEAGNTVVLAALLERCEFQPDFLSDLVKAVENRRKWFSRDHEMDCFRSLLSEF